MPSVHQLKKNNQVKPQKTNSPKWFKLMIMAMLGVVAFRHFFGLKTVDIPQAVYANTTQENQFYPVIHGKRKIVWFGADCPVSASRQKMVDTTLKALKLDDVYEQRAFLQNSYMSTCYGEGCVDTFLIENCGGNFCAVFPSSRKIVKFDFNDFTFMSKLQNMREW